MKLHSCQPGLPALRTNLFRLLVCAAFACSLLVPNTLVRANKGAGAMVADQQSGAPLSIVDTMPHVSLDSGDVMDATALANAHSTGAKVLRMSVLWSDIEPQDTDPT